MLRDGSSGTRRADEANGADEARRNGNAGAIGADVDADAGSAGRVVADRADAGPDAPAELVDADHPPSGLASAQHNPAGDARADLDQAGRVAAVHITPDSNPDRPSPNHDTAVGHAPPDPTASLSLPRLSAAALAGLGRDELTGVLGGIERLANRLAGYRAEVLGALEVLSESGAAPDRVPHLTLRDAAGVSERDARQMVRAARKAREHHGVLEALSDGGINAAQAETLSDARVPDVVRAELVAAAGDEDTDATRRRVRRAEAEHCVETPMERFERQRKARGAGWQRDHEGMLRLWAKLDPEAGAQVEAQLEMLRREYWIDDKQVRNGRRTPAQRDADVLAYVLAGITLTDADAAAVDRLHARARRNGHVPDGPAPSRRTTPPKSAGRRSAAGRTRPGLDASDATSPGQYGHDCCDAGHCQDGHGMGHSQDGPGAHLRPGGRDAGLRLDRHGPDPTKHDEPNTGPGQDGRHADLRLDRHGSDPTGRVEPSHGEDCPGGFDSSWHPVRRLPPAQISVLIGLDALRGQTDEVGLTDAGTELPPEMVRRLACDSEIIPMTLSGPGGSADVGRARRTVPRRLRRLLVARDRHCQWPGCHEPPSRCDAHHVWHWIDGGPTNLDNLVLLCHRHHHHLHEHGYKMVPQPDGTWTTVQESEPKPTPRRGKRQARAP